MKIKKCKRCNQRFTPYSGNQKYCGERFKVGTCSYLMTRASCVRWREENPEAYKSACAKFRVKNRLLLMRRKKQWYKNNKEKQAAWYQRSKDRLRPSRLKTYLKREYGISPEQYTSLLAKQGNLCALCKKPLDLSNRKKLHLDHDHGTKKIRGILHPSCNHGIGYLRDDPKLCRMAAEYLERFQ